MSLESFSVGFAAGFMSRNFVDLFSQGRESVESIKPSTAAPVVRREEAMFRLPGSKPEKPAKVDTRPIAVQQANPGGGLFSFRNPLDLKKSLVSSALDQGRSVEIELASFDQHDTPFKMTTRIK
jgi:hypothetical protein